MAGDNGAEQTASDEQLAQIEDVKIKYPGHVRVISYVGDVTSVVTVQPVDNIDVHVKLQLTSTYPSAPATISIRSQVLTPDEHTSLTEKLTNQADKKDSQSTISNLIASCNDWLMDNDITTVAPPLPSKNRKSKGKNKSQKKNKNTKEDEDVCVKKAPMKTAADVIKRLQWDEALDKEEFIVGYMDRIVGLVERCFTAFTWEDLASVDHFSLAIPQHRIQYFKYKTEMVWDKRVRLDNVFGSTGSGITMPEAIRTFDEQENATSEANDAYDQTSDDNTPTTGTTAVVDEAEAERVETADVEAECNERVAMETRTNEPVNDNVSSMNTYSAMSNNEGIAPSDTTTCTRLDNVEHGETDECSNSTWNDGCAGKTTAGLNDNNDATAKSSVATADNRGRRQSSVNHFVAFHITDEELIGKLVEAQDTIISHYPRYAPYRTPRNGFHLTLAVMLLQSAEDERDCVVAMDRAHKDISAFQSTSEQLSFSGLGYFSTKVIFAKVQCSPAFCSLVERIKASLRKACISIEERAFKPHLTLFNVRRSVPWPRDDTLELGGTLANMDFGSQVVDNVKVCRMGPLPSNTGDTAFCYRSIWHHSA